MQNLSQLPSDIFQYIPLAEQQMLNTFNKSFGVLNINYDFGFKTLKELDQKTRMYMNGFYVSSTVCTVGTVIALMRKRYVLAGLLAGLVVGSRYGAAQIQGKRLEVKTAIDKVLKRVDQMKLKLQKGKQMYKKGKNIYEKGKQQVQTLKEIGSSLKNIIKNDRYYPQQ